MARAESTSRDDAEALNDRFAREHDIDDYYARSGLLIRAIEQKRLRIIERMMRARPGEAILEVGCGGGHVLSLFRAASLTGVDVSGEMLAKATKNLAGYDVRLLKGDLGELGLADGSFDGIVCSEVLEHVVDPEQVLCHIRRLVKPTGRIVITFPNDALINRLKEVVRKSGLAALPPFRRVAWGGDDYHLHVWSVREMRALLSRHFSVVDVAHAPSTVLRIRCCFLCVPRC
jgi:ubiquinone/menaquinone biosynthesis C-methylase UbiE